MCNTRTSRCPLDLWRDVNKTQGRCNHRLSVGHHNFTSHAILKTNNMLENNHQDAKALRDQPIFLALLIAQFGGAQKQKQTNNAILGQDILQPEISESLRLLTLSHSHRDGKMPPCLLGMSFLSRCNSPFDNKTKRLKTNIKRRTP